MRIAFSALLALMFASSTLASDGSAFVVLNCDRAWGTGDAVTAIESAGGCVRHVFPGCALIASGITADVEEHPSIDKIYFEDVAPPFLVGRPRMTALAATAWMRSRNGDRIPRAQQSDGDVHLWELVVPKDSSQWDGAGQEGRYDTFGTATGAGFYDVSEYMMGTVTLSVVLPESNGAIDPNLEDWTTEEEELVVARMYQACDFWVAKAAEYSAPLTFYYNFEFAVPTGYEPISRPITESGLWITEIMNDFGYAGSVAYMVHEYVNERRADTDWGTVAFVVDSSSDADDKFADGHIALSVIGGPYLIMTTYDNEVWTIADIAAHEIGHSFYAKDQYSSSGCECSTTAGYLNVRNENCQAMSCLWDDDYSVMINPPWTHLELMTVDPYGAGQLGWQDSDDDGICDILDTNPVAAITSWPPDPAENGELPYEGTASATFFPNTNPRGEQHDISINEIADVQWRVDSGAWTSAVAGDGAFDEGEESFSFVTDSLAVGTHVIEVTAVNNVGNQSEEVVTDTVTVVDWVGVPETEEIAGTKLYPSSPNPFGAAASIKFEVRSPTAVTLRIYDLSGRQVRDLVDSVSEPPGVHVVLWDGLDDARRPVPSGVYFYRLEADGAVLTRKAILLK